MKTRIIHAYLDAVKGMHAPFGEEGIAVKNYLEAHSEQPTKIYIGSPTQFFALDLLCHENNWTLIIFNEKGNQFKDVVCAHRYINYEYIMLDLAGEIANFNMINDSLLKEVLLWFY